MGRFVANKSTHLHPPKEDISVEIAVTITSVNGSTRISVKVTRPDSRIPMLFSFLSRITLANHGKSRFPQLSIIPNPARYFYKHPVSRYQNNRDPASRKTYWGPSWLWDELSHDHLLFELHSTDWNARHKIGLSFSITCLVLQIFQDLF